MVHGLSHPMLNVLCFYITTFQREKEREREWVGEWVSKRACGRVRVCVRVCVCVCVCVCVQCPMCLFSVVPWGHVFVVCCSGIFWMALIPFQSPEIAKSINIHVPLSLSRIAMSGLLLGVVLSVCHLLLLLLLLLLYRNNKLWSWKQTEVTNDVQLTI